MLFSPFVFSALFLPAVLGQNLTSDPSGDSDGTASKATTSAQFDAPTVTGTACGRNQQNFNQCVTKVAKDINSCSSDEVCLCQTYANIAACYNACPDLDQGATYKQQSDQNCAQAHVSPKASLYNTTSTPVAAPAATTPTQTPSSVTVAPAATATASSFARSSGTSSHDVKWSSSLLGLATGFSAILFL